MTADVWLRDGTKLFLATLAGLGDDALDAESAVPGWRRRHVVAHVHYNAEALRRLASWARTGKERRMYASAEQRSQEIEDGAARCAADLRRMVADSADRLAADLDGLSADAWQSEVVTAQGRRIKATEITWLRVREVAVHAVDLRAGTTFADLPDDLTEALLVDVVKRRARLGEGAALATWITGRSSEAPVLGTWL